MTKCLWTKDFLNRQARIAKSKRQLLGLLGLVQAGGNYATMQKYLKKYEIDISHFTGQGWRIGATLPVAPARPLKEIMVMNSTYGSYKLKRRLFAADLKPRHCEECGWSKMSLDGRVPLELDHINGNRYDNRLENLRILCPNCHSLKPTHRGLNRGKQA